MPVSLSSSSAPLEWLAGSARRRAWIVLALVSLSVGLRWWGVAIPAPVFGLMAAFMAVTVALAAGVRHLRTDRARFRAHTVALCGDAVCVAAAYAYTDGARWLGVGVFALLVLLAGASLPRRNALLVTLACAAAFSAVPCAEAAGLLARHSPFPAGGAPGADWTFAIAASAMGTAMLFIVVALQRGFVRLVRDSEERHRALVESASDMIGVFDAQGRLVAVNAAGEALLGYARAAALGRAFVDFVAADDQPAAAAHCGALLLGAVRRFEARLVRPDGAEWWAAWTCTPLREGGRAAGRVSGFMAVVRDTTRERAGAEAVRASEARYRSLVEATAQTVWTTNAAGHVVEDAPMVTAFTGLPAETLRGLGYLDAVHPEDRARVLAAFQVAFATRTPLEVEHRLRRHDGLWRDMVARSVPIVETDGRVREWVGAHTDVTDRKALQAELAYQAFHDPLTGLANRALFGDRVAQSLAQGQRRPGGVAVLFLDLDNFKVVNDSRGHGAGDALLKQVAVRLLNATRGCDTVARLGGDEFAVLLDGVADDAQTVIVAERVLASLARPVLLDAAEVTVGASIGIASARDGDGPEEVLRNADVAMYRAKQRGKGVYEVFAPAMYEALRERVSLEGELRQALEHGGLSIAYQPIVALDDARVVGVEALVRWAHPTRGLIPPAEFIPVAEDAGLIVRLGRWVLREACQQSALWAGMAGGSVYVSVNVSGYQLQDPGLVADVAAALADAGLDPAGLLLEITESVVMQNTEANLATLRALKALGVRLAIDDFGTGYSSLAYLQRFPVDVLKIDKAFVDHVARGGSDAALARTIIALGETLGLRTVAEGVEVAAQRDHLRALGCGYAQGYLFARPLAAAQVDEVVRRGVAGRGVGPTAEPAVA